MIYGILCTAYHIGVSCFIYPNNSVANKLYDKEKTKSTENQGSYFILVMLKLKT